jgi:transcriptional regulator with XRE-family HTH domain
MAVPTRPHPSSESHSPPASRSDPNQHGEGDPVHPYHGVIEAMLKVEDVTPSNGSRYKRYTDDAYHAAFALVYRAGIEHAYAAETQKQETVAGAVTRLLTIPSTRDSRWSETETKIGQSYIAGLLRSFAPSIVRMAAFARAIRVAPSVTALVAESVLDYAKRKRLELRADDKDLQKWVGEWYGRFLRGVPRGSKAAKDEPELVAWTDPIRLDGKSPLAEGVPPVHAEFAPGLGIAIQCARHDRGLTQEQLAERLKSTEVRKKHPGGASPSSAAVSHLENKEHSPSWPRLFGIAKVLKTSLSQLFYDAEWHAAELALSHTREVEQFRNQVQQFASRPDTRNDPKLRAILDSCNAYLAEQKP